MRDKVCVPIGMQNASPEPLAAGGRILHQTMGKRRNTGLHRVQALCYNHRWEG